MVLELAKVMQYFKSGKCFFAPLQKNVFAAENLTFFSNGLYYKKFTLVNNVAMQ